MKERCCIQAASAGQQTVDSGSTGHWPVSDAASDEARARRDARTKAKAAARLQA